MNKNLKVSVLMLIDNGEESSEEKHAIINNSYDKCLHHKHR